MNLSVIRVRQRRRELIPVSWVVEHVVPKGRQDGAVEPFDLPIRLGVIRGRERVVRPHDLAHVHEESRGKLFAVVAQKNGRRSVAERPVSCERTSNCCFRDVS